MAKHHHSRHDDIEEAQKRAAKAIQEKDSKGRFRFPQGRTTFRILPTPGDKERNSPPLYLTYLIHDKIGPKKRFCRCGLEPGEHVRRGECWIHDKAGKLIKQKRTKEAAVLSPREQLAVQIAVLDKEEDEWIGPLFSHNRGPIHSSSSLSRRG